MNQNNPDDQREAELLLRELEMKAQLRRVAQEDAGKRRTRNRLVGIMILLVLLAGTVLGMWYIADMLEQTKSEVKTENRGQ